MKEGGEKGERRKPPRKEKREDGEDGGGEGTHFAFVQMSQIRSSTNKAILPIKTA